MIDIPGEIKELFKKSNIQRNFRISFPNGEHEDITNSELVSESVELTESIFSNDFKFGLCEASVLQFQTYNNIMLNGLQIKAQIEIDVTEAITYGTNTAKSDASGYYKIQSSVASGNVIFYSCQNGIDSYVYKDNDGNVIQTERDIFSFKIYWMKAGTLEIYTKTNKAIIEIKYPTEIPEGTQYRIDLPYPYYPISYGCFVVDSCKRSANSKIRTVIAYSNQIANNKYSDSFVLFATGLSSTRSITIDAMKFLASNIPFFNMDLFTKTQKSLVNETIIDFSTNSGGYTVSVKTISKRLTVYSGDLYELNYDCKKLTYKNAYYDFCAALERQGISPSILPTFDESWYKLKQVMFGDASIIGYLADNPRAIYIPTGTDSYIYIPYSAEFKIISNGGTIYNKKVTPLTPTAYSCENSAYMTYNHTFYKKMSATVSGFYSLSINDIENAVPISSIAQSLLEMNVVFGVNDREINKFTLKPLTKYSGISPSKSLNPGATLNPQKGSDFIYRQSMYSALWYSDFNSNPYGKIMCSFVDINDANRTNRNYQDVLIPDIDLKAIPYKTYDFSNNYYVSNYAQSSKVSATIIKLENALIDFEYRPISMEAAGMPFVEPGDWLDIVTNDGNVFSYVARRTLSGIQQLVDSIDIE